MRSVFLLSMSVFLPKSSGLNAKSGNDVLYRAAATLPSLVRAVSTEQEDQEGSWSGPLAEHAVRLLSDPLVLLWTSTQLPFTNREQESNLRAT